MNEAELRPTQNVDVLRSGYVHYPPLPRVSMVESVQNLQRAMIVLRDVTLASMFSAREFGDGLEQIRRIR